MSRLRHFRIPLTTIGRSINLRIPTNLAIVLLVAVSFVLAVTVYVVLGEPWQNALLKGLALAGSVFFGWALCRETDPDRRASAFFAAAGAAAGAILLGGPYFLLLFWFMLALRYINRTTGAPPGALDWAGMYGINLWLGFAAHWTIPLLAFPTVFFAGLRRFPTALRVGLTLVLPAAAVAYGFLRRWRFTLPAWNSAEILVSVGVALAVAPVIASYRTVRSVGDRTSEPLTPHRIQWALGWAVVAAVVLTLSGTSTIREIGPLLAALAGASLGWLAETVIQRILTSSGRA